MPAEKAHMSLCVHPTSLTTVFPTHTQSRNIVKSLGQTRLLVALDIQGSYGEDCVKFKDFSRTSKRLSYCFQAGLKNTDLHVKILLRKCYSPLLKVLAYEN